MWTQHKTRLCAKARITTTTDEQFAITLCFQASTPSVTNFSLYVFHFLVIKQFYVLQEIRQCVYDCYVRVIYVHECAREYECVRVRGYVYVYV